MVHLSQTFIHEYARRKEMKRFQSKVNLPPQEFHDALAKIKTDPNPRAENWYGLTTKSLRDIFDAGRRMERDRLYPVIKKLQEVYVLDTPDEQEKP